MWGNELISGFAGLVLSLVAPLANTALVAPTTGTVDCGLTVSQSGVTSGTTVQLTWWTVNAASVTMSDNGSQPVNVNPSGSIPLTINANHSFALVVRNSYGSKTCTASISSSTQTNNGPTCAISATPGTHYAGQGVQIVWYSQNATTGQVGGVGTVSGSQLSSGSATIYPQQSTTVSMQVRNNYGSNTCNAPITITPRPSSTTQQPTYTTTSYRPVTTPSYAPTSQPLIYRPTTSGSPSYSNPSYSNARYPSPAYSSGWYPDPRISSRSNYYDSLGSPSYSNGLGDYTLTNMWNNAYSGEALISNHDCFGIYCDSQPNSWGLASHIQADGTEGPMTYRIGGDGDYGYEQYTFDGNGKLLGTNREISLDELQNGTFSAPPPGMYGYLEEGSTNDVQGIGSQTENTFDGNTAHLTAMPSVSSGYLMNTQEYPDSPGYFSGANIQSGLVSTPSPTPIYSSPAYYNFDTTRDPVGLYDSNGLGGLNNGSPSFDVPTDGYIYNPAIMEASLDNSSFQDSYLYGGGGVSDWFSPADSGVTMPQEIEVNTQWDSWSPDGNWL